MTPQDLLTLVLVAVPGLGIAFLAYSPGAISLAARLALAFGFGYGVVALLSAVLAAFGALRTNPLIALLTLVTVVVWVAALRRFSLRGHVVAIAEQVRAQPWPLISGLLVLLGIVIVRLTIDPVTSFPGVASFRYWGDATEIADTGGWPALSLQYGELYPPATSKSLLDAFAAGLIVVLGRDPLALMGGMLFVGSVGIAVALWGVAWELGLRYSAALLPLLLVANEALLNTDWTLDMDVYRAEAFGRLVATCAIVAGIRALRERGWVDVAATGALAGLGLATHLIALLIAAIFLGWFLVGRLLLRASIRSLAVRSAVVLVVAIALGGVVHLLPRGSLAFEGAGGSGYDTVARDFDPTLFLLSGGLTDPTEEQLAEEAKLGPIGFMESAFGTSWPREEAGNPYALPALILLAALIIAVLMFLFLPRELKTIGLVGWGTAATMIAITVFFAFRNDVFILVVWGRRRLFDYSGVPFLLMALGLAEAALWALTRKSPRLAGAAAAALIIAVAAVTVPSAAGHDDDPALDQGAKAVHMLNWIRANTSCDSSFLANQRTVGVFKSMTGRSALLEGMSPYLRPGMLDHLTELMLETRAFYRDPAAHTDLLQRNGIDYVVVLEGLRLGHSFGAKRLGRAFRTTDFLELTYRGSSSQIYEVVGLHEEGEERDANTLPGYLCERDPIAA